MKFGIRTPSLKRRFAARTSWKRYMRHSLGLKAPRGFGLLTNPKKALYNKVYNRTSVSVDRLFKTRNRKMGNATVPMNPSSGGVLFWSIVIFVLLVLYWPIGLIVLFISLFKLGQNKPVDMRNEVESSASSKDGLLPAVQDKAIEKADFLLNIPEPTRSLLWVSNESTSKIESPFTLTVSITADGVKTSRKGEDNFHYYAEPSLIWTQLPIEVNEELEKDPMYYPTYAGLEPKQRYQYLKWLEDVTKPTNLSYVFLYFYGLERHLLVGNYEQAFEEVLRMLKHHDKGTFRNYAIASLIASSVARSKQDFLEKAPFLLDEVNSMSLALKLLRKDALTAKEIIGMSYQVGFNNRIYIKKFPEQFQQELEKALQVYEMKNGDILTHFEYQKLPKESAILFANTSLPEEIRTVNFPNLLKDEEFKQIIKTLLSQAHEAVKEYKKITKTKS